MASMPRTSSAPRYSTNAGVLAFPVVRIYAPVALQKSIARNHEQASLSRNTPRTLRPSKLNKGGGRWLLKRASSDRKQLPNLVIQRITRREVGTRNEPCREIVERDRRRPYQHKVAHLPCPLVHAKVVGHHCQRLV